MSPVRLFLAFVRLGLTAFGGPAMVAYIRTLAVEKKQWLSGESFADGVALCQSVPGATAMQTAGYVGLRAGGPAGALAAFVGFGLPAFVLMAAFSAGYAAGRDAGVVVAVFNGLRVIVVAVIANAAVQFGRRSIRDWRDAVLACGAAAFLILGGSPMVAVVASAALSVALYHGVALPSRAPSTVGVGGARRMLRAAAIVAAIAVAGLAVLFLLDRRLFLLAALMMKVDVFAFGGGFASVPLMLHEVVDVRHWVDGRVFMDGIALGQVTPGPIVITATFVGYQVAGPAGAVVATLGIFTPSFLVLLVAVPYFDRLQGSALFRRAVRGVLASFVGLLLSVAVSFGVAATWTVAGVALAAGAFAALVFGVDILWVVLAGAVASAFVS